MFQVDRNCLKYLHGEYAALATVQLVHTFCDAVFEAMDRVWETMTVQMIDNLA